ncbi:YqeG family HAD IIIA-type phosphatase [Kurthia massiliensis]|uniref:YqeG family HAD IIIA-type phosphatase n=1 Tax=Kurthia massiliensis TaxID=1033739 RepID=UPI0002881DB1|nr:YqeG family HAD IIIA-type phosphatase [Kurthia massiliensis]
MYKRFMPKEFVNSVYDVTPEKLHALGIKGIITDLDNTLVEWDRADATPELMAWLKLIQDSGIQVIIVSNNKEARVKHFADPLGIQYIFQARKPLRNAFKRGLKMLNLPSEQVLMLGDQMMTDMLGGNALHLYTILVKPVAQSDGFVTKLNRRLERRVFNYLRKHGIETWREK